MSAPLPAVFFDNVCVGVDVGCVDFLSCVLDDGVVVMQHRQIRQYRLLVSSVRGPQMV